ncbi:MAG: branched-chain amino acid ABC transporter permease [Betaproteobacteria bacterium]|nr:branched-chain amino acid ABC transporter permease [Betaproteobacteria bacterium]
MDLFLQQMFNGLLIGSTYALVALGFTLVLGTLDLLNFAHGETIMFAAYAGLMALLASGGSMLAALGASLAVGAVIGLAVYAGSFRWVRKKYWASPALSTVGMALILQTLATRLWGTDQKAVPDPMGDTQIQFGPVLAGLSHIAILVVTLLIMVGLHALLRYTRIGKAMRAVAEDHVAASLLGVPVGRTIATTFLISGLLAGAAGILTSLVYHTITPFIGLNILLKGMTGMVIGGLGNVYGAMFGGVVVGILETLAVNYLSSIYQDVVVFAALILVLMFKPAGLFGVQIRDRV